jgi:curved DNA-binding protein CbpA
MNSADSRDLFELLGLDRESSSREVREQYRRRMALFDPSSPVLYGLYTEAEAQAFVDRLRLAYQRWLDARQLSPLDSFSEEPEDGDDMADLIDAAPIQRTEPGEAPPSFYDGPTLSRVREERGLSLENIAQRTKIAMFTLRSIELDRFPDLPPKVYLKGFLKQYAVLLGLNPNEVVADYMGRMQPD